MSDEQKARMLERADDVIELLCRFADIKHKDCMFFRKAGHPNPEFHGEDCAYATELICEINGVPLMH